MVPVKPISSSRVLAALLQPRRLAWVVGALPALLLAACGGGQASIGGTVTGLASGRSVVLQNNSADNLTVVGTGAASIPYAFATEILAAKTYSVSVLTQPVGQTCAVSNPSGTIATAAVDITNITVACTTTSSVVGTVTGLATGVAVTLKSNGVTLVAGNGSFSFPGVLTTGSTYAVTVATQPSGQTCSISNASGTVVANTAAVATVTCL